MSFIDDLRVDIGDDSGTVPSGVATHEILSASHGDATVGSPTSSALIVGNGSTWTALPSGAEGYVLKIKAGTAAWASGSTGGVSAHRLLSSVHTDTSTNNASNAALVYGSGTTWNALPSGTEGYFLGIKAGQLVWTTGLRGPTGATGPSGATGATGPAGSGTQTLAEVLDTGNEANQQIYWTTSLGDIQHLLGPSDDAFNIASASGENIELFAGTVLRAILSPTGTQLINTVDINKVRDGGGDGTLRAASGIFSTVEIDGAGFGPAEESEVLVYNGADYVGSGIPTSYPPNGVAGGDLFGTYPNPSVSSISGVTVNRPLEGQALIYNGTDYVGSGVTSGGGGGGTTISSGNLTEAVSNILTISGGDGAVVGTGTTVEVSQASAGSDGYLSSADWSTFNSKEDALPLTTRGDVLYRDSSNTTARLPIGESGQFLASNGDDVLWGNIYTNGFENRTDSTIVFDDATRTLTISPTSSSFSYYSNGNKYTKDSAVSGTIPNIDGLHYFYFDGPTIVSTTTWNDELITKYATVADVHWDATNSRNVIFGDERHGYTMSPVTHLYLHDIFGAKIESGGALGDILADENGSSDSHCQFSIEATAIHDEDIQFSHTAKTSSGNIGIYYRFGADSGNTWRSDETSSLAVLPTGTGRAGWNELNGSNWEVSEVDNGDFVLAHVVAIHDTDRKYAILMGQGEYNNLGDARDAAETEINNLVLNGLPDPEMVFLGTIIVQTSNAYGNSVKSRIRTTTEGDDYIDLRGRTITRAGTASTVTDHASLGNLDYANAGHTGFEPTLPLSTRGDLLTRNSSNVTDRLAIGSSGTCLTTDGQDASWNSPGGDLAGHYPSPSVVAISGSSFHQPLSSQVVVFNGTSYAGSGIPTSYPPNGAAGGDLSGTYPNPNVVAISGITVNIPLEGQVLIYNGTDYVGSGIDTTKTLASVLNDGNDANQGINWASGLGAITHLQGPTDQDFKLDAPNDRYITIYSNGGLQSTFTPSGVKDIRVHFDSYSEKLTTITSSGTVNISPASGNVYKINMTGNVDINLLSAGDGYAGVSLTTILHHDGGGRSVTWMSGINWADSTAPTLSSSDGDIDIISFVSVDHGVNWYGIVGGLTF